MKKSPALKQAKTHQFLNQILEKNMVNSGLLFLQSPQPKGTKSDPFTWAFQIKSLLVRLQGHTFGTAF